MNIITQHPYITTFISLFIFVSIVLLILHITNKPQNTNTQAKDTNKSDTKDKTTSVSSNCDENCQKWLNEHNKYRTKAGYQPLTWDDDFMEQSKKYATILNNTGEFKHGLLYNPKCSGSRLEENSNMHRCGQNLQKSLGSSISTPHTSISRWMDECSKYNKIPTTGRDVHDTGGHYSQVMWKDAKKVGCATVGQISACLYDKGNMLGEFGENVPLPGNCIEAPIINQELKTNFL